jgi:hypothetical protein
MAAPEDQFDGATRLAYILGVPLAEQASDGRSRAFGRIGCDRGRQLSRTHLEVGRRLHLAEVVVVEWTCNYVDGRLYRNVTIAELEGGRAVSVTDYWGEPTTTPAWRESLTDRLDMPGDGIWPDDAHLGRF